METTHRTIFPPLHSPVASLSHRGSPPPLNFGFDTLFDELGFDPYLPTTNAPAPTSFHSSINQSSEVEFLGLPNDLIDFITDYDARVDASEPGLEHSPEMLTNRCDAFACEIPSINTSRRRRKDLLNPLPECHVTHEVSALANSSRHKFPKDDRISRKRLSNRQSAFRYRQKIKAKNELLENELSSTLSRYKSAKHAYDRLLLTYGELQRLALDLLKSVGASDLVRSQTTNSTCEVARLAVPHLCYLGIALASSWIGRTYSLHGGGTRRLMGDGCASVSSACRLDDATAGASGHRDSQIKYRQLQTSLQVLSACVSETTKQQRNLADMLEDLSQSQPELSNEFMKNAEVQRVISLNGIKLSGRPNVLNWNFIFHWSLKEI
ncbi:unnamed protein product [Protopolystoma xenopodis]|uniref:BZIP domain-containing protein n=1 Tax=Protopolystoma xenopodis TaxID=117903 RepID=A0A448XD19_9PLAT|nr:unnamed protein product [Protopolystoma xenopodis]